MRELSLFTGAGGGLLGTKLLGWEHIGYVEWNEYCQQVIAARIRDGYLPAAPIFTDVREFVQSGAAEQYRGFADVVTAGFPCQPFSVAGKQAGADDERNMWPATRDVIRIVQPRSVLFENVPGLISCGYLGTVIADLATLGYVGRWGVIGASDCGAPHIRKRLWIVAHTDRDGLQKRVHESISCSRPNGGKQERSSADGVLASPDASDTNGGKRSLGREAGRAWWVGERFSQIRDWPLTSEPVLDRGSDGVAYRLDRLRAAGNGQVPAVVRRAWECLA